MTITDYMCALIIAGLILLAVLWSRPVSAGQCERWARLVDFAARVEQPERDRHFERWLAVYAKHKNTVRMILRARAYIDAGGTPRGAWRQCPSF